MYEVIKTGDGFPQRPKWIEHGFAWFLRHTEGAMARVYGEIKHTLFAPLTGTVLEIGPGTGPNLPYYPKHIRLLGIEPNPFMHPYLHEKCDTLGLDFTVYEGHAERLPVPDESVDAVVSTLVLCSVFEPGAVLREVLRVLRPGGQFVYIEHVAAGPGTGMRRLQRVIKPVWRCCGDGCHPDRETWTAIESAGFSQVHLEHRRIKTPFYIIDPHIVGTAVK